MANVTLTTVVRNSATLPLLLKLTDQLVALKLLTSLRIVDETNDSAQAFEIRSCVKTDGDKGQLIPHFDESVITELDSKAFVAMKMTGYYHQASNKKLVQNGPSLTVGVRGGGVLGLNSLDNRKFELVFGQDSCFIRAGRGGGTVLVTHPESGISCGGREWKLYEVSWQDDKLFVSAQDTGATFFAQCPRMDGPLDVTVSAPVQGCADIILSELPSLDLINESSTHRAYATYHTNAPNAAEGSEIVSKDDIVYIDIEKWSALLTGSVPLTVGDISDTGTFRRAGLIESSSTEREVHASFLSRSRGIIDKTRKLLIDGVEVQSSNDSVVNVDRVVKLGTPVLFATLSKNLAGDKTLCDGYMSLLVDGPVGEQLATSAKDLLVYLDSLSADPGAMKDFLSEVVESLQASDRQYLRDLLTKSSN